MSTIEERLGFTHTHTASEEISSLGKNESKSEQTIQEISISASEIAEVCTYDLNFFAGLAMPLVFQYFFPKTFLEIWSWLLVHIQKTRDFSQLALGLPRGFGKTMLMKLFLLYCILFTSRKFLLILCENQTKANNILSDVADMLNEPNIVAVFGDWKLGIETDRQDLKKFGFRGRNIILMAGTVEVIRGITLKNERPDVMLFDDIQSRVMAESITQSETLEREMTGTAMKAKSPHGCLFLFVGNMYPTKHSILRKLKNNPNWLKFIAGGILADGTSLWEELQPIDQLMKEFENDLMMGHPEIFYAEVMNDENATTNNFIDISKIPDTPYEGEIPTGNFIIIDPATDKPGSDAVSVGYAETFDGGIPVLKEVTEDSLSPLDTIITAITYCLKYNCRLVCVEANAYQYSLKFWFDYVCAQREIVGIECVPIYSGIRSKNSRIIQMFKSLLARELYIGQNAKAAAFLQITQFNPLKKDNTDGVLDLLTYMPRVVAEFGEYVMNMNVIDMQEFDACKVLDVSQNCLF